MSHWEYGGSLYPTERERNVAAAYDWLTAGGKNSPASCLDLSGEDLQRELGVLRRECELDREGMDEDDPRRQGPTWHAMVIAGLDDAMERLRANGAPEDVYTWQAFSSNPNTSGPNSINDEEELEASSDEEACAGATSELEIIAAGLSADEYSVGDRIYAQVWSSSGLSWTVSHVLTEEDLNG